MRRTLGSLAAVAAAMSLIGVAWASDDSPKAEVSTNAAVAAQSEAEVDDDFSTGLATRSSADIETTSSLDAGQPSTTSTTVESDTTSTTLGDGTTSTTIENDTTSTTVDDGTTSTTIGEGTTSTTIDDDHDQRDDDTGSALVGLETYTVAGVGTVTINFLADAMVLVDVDAPGWEVEIKKAESARIEVEFTNGSTEAEFEARIDSGGGVSIEIETA